MKMRNKRKSVELSAEEIEKQILECAKRFEFIITEYTVEILAEKVENNEIFIPKYQREFIWSTMQQSRFIESIILGIPIPFIVFCTDAEGRLEIVDGSQRLRTLSAYFRGDLKLTGLKTLTKLNGLRFSDLLVSRQRRIRNKSIRGIILSESLDADSRREVFERINTTSKIANPAEVRRGAFDGNFLNMITEEANSERFRKLAPLTENSIKLRDNEELVTRFFAYSDGLQNYKDNPKDFLWDYVRDKAKDCEKNPLLVDEYRSRIRKTLDLVDKLFPLGFRASKGSNDTKRARFEAISIGTYLAAKECPELFLKANSDFTHWAYETEFNQTCRGDGANAKAKLLGRINFVKERLLGHFRSLESSDL